MVYMVCYINSYFFSIVKVFHCKSINYGEDVKFYCLILETDLTIFKNNQFA